MKKIMFVCLLFLNSCGVAEDRLVIGNYYLIAVDLPEQMGLDFRLPSNKSGSAGIVSPCIFAVGYNDKYIVAKQHPYRSIFTKSPNKKITNYFIVPVQDTINRRTINNTIGPLNQNQFEQKRKELGIENIEFTIVYKDLE